MCFELTAEDFEEYLPRRGESVSTLSGGNKFVCDGSCIAVEIEMTEQEASSAVLKWCRDRNGPCMRLVKGDYTHVIVDNSKWSGPVLYRGCSWLDVWKQINKG